jgi:Rad3-related DNA helicase
VAQERAFWGLETARGEKLSPRAYSHGGSQLDAVADIIRAFDEGASDVFFHANLGSGKSLIALHVIANMGRGIVVVPTKNLQDQYAEDYEGKYVIRDARKKRMLRIRVMKGRKSFHCAFHGKDAASPDLVCTKELPSSTPRWKAAMKCPDWSPVYKGENAQKLADATFLHEGAEAEWAFQQELAEKGRPYEAVFHEFVYVARGNPCPYFAQYAAYSEADAIVMNQAKWEAETSLARKPRLDVEVFDEADHFLDSLGSTVEIGAHEIDTLLRRFVSLSKKGRLDPDARPSARDKAVVAELQEARKRLADKTQLGECEPPVETMQAVAKVYESMEGDEPARRAGQLRDALEHPDALVCTKKEDRYLVAVGEPQVILRSLLAKSGPKRLWMSATLQDAAILRDVYGFRNPVIVQGETAYQGQLHLCVPEDPAAAPVPVRWEAWYGPQGQPLREGFDRALSFIQKHAKGPTAYVVHGKGYLESIAEWSAAARKVVKLLEKERESDETLRRFLAGETDEIASTRMNRGVDLKGDLCRDLVLIKLPLPDISDPKLQAIKKKFAQKYGDEIGEGAFWRYARDCARRTLLQQVGRGMRAPDDWVRVWTTDQAVLDFLRARFPDKRVVHETRVRTGQRKLPPA